MRVAFVSMLFLLMQACAVAPPRPSPDAGLAACLALYEATDIAVARHGYSPTSSVRVRGFPNLRVDRFLASFHTQPLDGEARAAWVHRLAALDQQARDIELASLPTALADELARRHAAGSTLGDALRGCSARLQVRDAADPDRMEALRARSVVPADYAVVNRLLGLYPISAVPVSLGIARWHAETRRMFAQPLAALPTQGELLRYRPPVEQPRHSADGVPRDALGVPNPDDAQLAALYAAHAPVWEIDVAGDFDRPGSPRWDATDRPSVDARQAVVYRYPSYTRWNGRSLLQLNFVIWFAERPSEGPTDMLAGALDGLVWRVTLDEDGRPLLYDSIHSCGCYHQFFPSERLRLRDDASALPEPPLVPQSAPLPGPGQRVVIRLSSGRHFIERLYGGADGGIEYAWAPYETLYAVRDNGATRSLFGADGLVVGTERGERWLLWPMGIPSPGAMRERGRQSTAFLGQRHFDDLDLLERLFEPTGVP